MMIEVPGLARGRILELEVMDDAREVKAYLDGVATAHLNRMDDTFVAAALRKLAAWRPNRGRPAPLALDLGTGTGALPVKMALGRPDIVVTGVDRARRMLDTARARALAAGVSERVSFRSADSRRLPFPDGTFDLVVSNSMLHHIPDPAPVMDEMARVLRRGGALFLRDLRRPHARVIERHIRLHGRHYKGTMLRLYSDSVRAAFTESELRGVVARSALGSRPHGHDARGHDARGHGARGHGARVRRMFETYLVVELP